MNNKPRVTAIIPTYNRARFLPCTIESVLRQTTPIDEIVVVDDGSTDATAEVVATFGERIKYLRQPNSGVSAARNRGMREASGDYITFLDSDDLWTPEKTETQIRFLHQNPKIDVVFANMSNFRGPPRAGPPEIKRRDIYEGLVAAPASISRMYEWLVMENIVPTPTVVIRRDVVEKVGYFDAQLRLAEDLDYWLRAAEKCRWGFVDAVLLLRRIHDSNAIADSVRRNLALLSVLKRAAERPAAQCERRQRLISQKTASVSYDVGSALFHSRDYRGACYHLDRAELRGRQFIKARVKYYLAAALALATSEKAAV